MNNYQVSKYTVVISFTQVKEDAVFSFTAPSLSALFSHLANITREAHTPIHNVKTLTIIPKV